MATPQPKTMKVEDLVGSSDFCQHPVPTMPPTSTLTSNQPTSLDLPSAEGQQQFTSLAPALSSMVSSVVPAPAPATASSLSASTAKGLPESFMHKSRLQQYTQKSGIPLPIYHTVNEGFNHLPKFRSTVEVDGSSYTSSNTYLHRKEAEQDVARIALECISKKTKIEECPPIHENINFCKSILHEFAAKMNMDRPTYHTIRCEGLLPAFETTLVFNGESYTGGIGKSKKEAEQLAARAVIRSLLGSCEFRMSIGEIIISKYKLYSTGASFGNIPPQHEWRPPKSEPSSEEINLPAPASQNTNLLIEFVPSEQAMFSGPSSAKRRRKNKKKANKKQCTGVQ